MKKYKIRSTSRFYPDCGTEYSYYIEEIDTANLQIKDIEFYSKEEAQKYLNDNDLIK